MADTQANETGGVSPGWALVGVTVFVFIVNQFQMRGRDTQSAAEIKTLREEMKFARADAAEAKSSARALESMLREALRPVRRIPDGWEKDPTWTGPKRP